MSEWRQYKETAYEISSSGLIRRNSYILKPWITNMGYMQIHLNYKGKRKAASIHRLVAEIFIPNPTNLPQVNHLDGNKLNNNINNLEWVSAKTNTLHKTRILNKGIGATNGKALYTSDIYEEMLKRKRAGQSAVDIAKVMKIAYDLVYHYTRRWEHEQRSTSIGDTGSNTP